MTHASPETSRPRSGRMSWRTALRWQWAIFLAVILVLGILTQPSDPPCPAGAEEYLENADIYGGLVPRAHPLGVFPRDDADLLEWLLMGLGRSLAGPLIACVLTVLLGGLWGTWAAYHEGRGEKLLAALALPLEALPRIVMFALITPLIRIPGVQPNLLHVTVAFALLQIPAVGLALRSHVRSVVREGYVEGLVSLGFPARTIIIRDLLRRECGPLLRLQYVARVTELVALETAVSFAVGGANERTVGWVLRRFQQVNIDRSPFELLLVACLAAYLLTLSAAVRERRPLPVPVKARGVARVEASRS